MVEISDITNVETLGEWLLGKPDQYWGGIAYRVVLRDFPAYLEFATKNIDRADMERAILKEFYGYLVAAQGLANTNARNNVMTSYLPDALTEIEKKQVLANRFFQARDSRNSPNTPFSINDDVGQSIDGSDWQYSLDNDAWPYVDYWSILQEDCEDVGDIKKLLSSPLWRGQRNIYVNLWASVKEKLLEHSIDWSFWIKWYEAALNGEPLNWDMLHEIALIDPKDWEQGPARVNALIAGIEARYEDERQDTPVTSVQLLAQNTSVIEKQLEVLAQLVTQEIDRIRGQNDFTKIEKERMDARVSVLEKIMAAVEEIRAALRDEEPLNALTVIEEKLPDVFNGAEKLAEQDDTQKISAPIVSMGVTIKYLTECNMPGWIASSVAALELVAKPIVGKFKKK